MQISLVGQNLCGLQLNKEAVQILTLERFTQKHSY